MKLLYYTCNGLGVGHVVRTSAIARWVTVLGTIMNREIEQYVLTSSDAIAYFQAEGLPVFKLPSLDSIIKARRSPAAYRPLARELVHQVVRSLKPDLFSVDTIPAGVFADLPIDPSLVGTSALVLRPVRAEVAVSPSFLKAAEAYPHIVVPDRDLEGLAAWPESLRARIRATGPVLWRDAVELPTRAAARARLGVRDDERVVLLAFGGGGDPNIDELLELAQGAVADLAAVRAVVPAGPLWKGSLTPDARTLSYSGRTSEILAGVDVAIAAAGYNTYNELMNAGVPTLFLPQARRADDQGRRAAEAGAAGAALVLNGAVDARSIRAGVEHLLEPAHAARAGQSARALVPRCHAIETAGALLSSILPSDEVAQAVVEAHARRFPSRG